MKDVPDITPEIRGLLQEIVDDPRSSMRLAPRRALRTWFEGGEAVRARDIASTVAERHLIDEHREALAELLCEAAWIAYWKAPVLTHKPLDGKGQSYDPSHGEAHWRERARRTQTMAAPVDIELLRQAIGGIRASDASGLAAASLGLVPCDLARFLVAMTLPWNRPRTAIRFFSQLASGAYPQDLRPRASLSLGSRLCAVGRLGSARDAYRVHSALVPNSPFGHFYAFNLSCFLGDATSAIDEASRLGDLVSADSPLLLEAQGIIREWSKSAAGTELAVAKRTCELIVDRIPDACRALCPPTQP